jgi:hypothetical protein
MSKHKLAALIDNKLRGKAYATREELHELGQACRDHGVSVETKTLLARLAGYPPAIRLAINMKTVIGLSAGAPVYNVLRDGLLPEEYIALVELDLCGLPASAREVAHGLLNVHERWCILKTTRRLFRDAISARDEFLSPNDKANL